MGVKGAYLLSNMAVDKDQIDENKNKSAFSVGFVSRSEGNVLFQQNELLYARKGARYSLSNSDLEVNANLDYLELPVSIGINLFNTPISVYAGAYAAYLLKADYEYENGSEEVVASYDNTDGFRRLDFGVQTGLQFKLDRLLLDARFSRGLRNVENEDILLNNQTILSNDTKNYNVQIGATLFF